MPATSYDYAIVRVVPRVERGECMNIGVILFCRTRRFLGMLIRVDEQRLLIFAPELDQVALKQQLDHLQRVCRSTVDSGPLGQMSQSERFHWLVAPRSTIVQFSAVHCGICTSPEETLKTLLEKFVL